MRHDKLYNEIERACKDERIMEKHYGVEQFNPNDPYFTDSQEMDIRCMISEGLEFDEIMSVIKKW
jgi:hypothetical protein